MIPKHIQERTFEARGMDRKYPMREYVIEMPCPICGDVIASMFELDGYQEFSKHSARGLERNFCLAYGEHMLSHYDKIRENPYKFKPDPLSFQPISYDGCKGMSLLDRIKFVFNRKHRGSK